MQQNWPTTGVPPALRAEEVHVWSVRLDIAETATPSSLLQTLSADERERAARFRVDDARRHFVAARDGLRRILAKYLNVMPERVAFTYDDSGKPHLQHSTDPPAMQFNLAHSGELALVAVSRGCEVGVDVERVREVHHWREIAERFFHPREVEEIAVLPTAQQLPAFLRCWAAKEAVLKAVGVGITRPLDFYVGSNGQQDGIWIELPIREVRSARCYLQRLVPAFDYFGAVSCVGAARRVCCFSFGAGESA